ncbi:hypothetical protein [Prescottella equi]|uniref:hypothetical protein n=1 Tax=Rhodococcus hoagii TaxID=43767 RepID=UPI001C8452E7|nr:hypothetical protein [Prescottella equi]
MTDTTLNAPIAEPSTSPAKRRRWPWIVAVIAALLAGIGLGAAGASDPTGERAKAVAAREESVAQQEQDLQARTDSEKTALDDRKTQLDRQSADLARRERELLPKEQEAAKNTIKGDGIFLVGKDINPGTSATAAAPDATGSGPAVPAATSTRSSPTATSEGRRSSPSRPPTSPSPASGAGPGLWSIRSRHRCFHDWILR